MNFRSVAHLSDQLLGWSKRLPSDIECIVGIPRSGLLAANLLSLYLNLPLTDLDGLIEGRCIAGGRRLAYGDKDRKSDDFLSTPRKILVLDDSVRTGSALRDVIAKLSKANLQHEILIGAVYVHPDHRNSVDLYCEVLNSPRVFEWNILHHANLSRCCFDMDGVLCADPTPAENDDGEAYLTFLETSRPLHLPSREIGWIVTSRLERYRTPTEDWLRRHGISYRELVMLDYPDGDTRRRMGTHGAFKADVYRRSSAQLFIESSARQAIEIARLSRKPVLCTDTMQMVYPGNSPKNRFQSDGDFHLPPASWHLKQLVRHSVPSSMTSAIRRLRLVS